jgi:hypothetical protein
VSGCNSGKNSTGVEVEDWVARVGPDKEGSRSAGRDT